MTHTWSASVPRTLAGILLAGVVTLTITRASPASAQDAASACAPDAMRLCGELLQGPRNLIAECLFRKRAQLSAECRPFMQPRGRKPR